MVDPCQIGSPNKDTLSVNIFDNSYGFLVISWAEKLCPVLTRNLIKGDSSDESSLAGLNQEFVYIQTAFSRVKVDTCTCLSETKNDTLHRCEF